MTQEHKSADSKCEKEEICDPCARKYAAKIPDFQLAFGNVQMLRSLWRETLCDNCYQMLLKSAFLNSNTEDAGSAEGTKVIIPNSRKRGRMIL